MKHQNTPIPARVAVLGAGLIGIDLASKIHRSPLLDCALVAGRTTQTLGLARAAALGSPTAPGGIEAVLEAGPFDVVCDASDADAHPGHWARLADTGVLVIDLTPSSVGTMVVPTINAADAAASRDISLITCGGQAAIPILHALTREVPSDYVEVVCSGASASAGRATRRNLDHYIATTQAAVTRFTGARRVKVLVNLSPATPPPPFRVTATVLPSPSGAPPTSGAARAVVDAAAAEVQAYAPGLAVTSCQVSDQQIRVGIEVAASGGHLPAYAGNLDIINAAAVLLAERYARTPTTAATPSTTSPA